MVEVRTRRLVNPARRRRNSGTKTGAAKSKATKWINKMYKFPKKKNPTTKKRKLSDKQIAIFGTPRQKAALRARKRNPGLKAIERRIRANYKKNFFPDEPIRPSGQRNNLVAKRMGLNSQYKYKMAQERKRAKRTKNVGEIVSISLAGLNPGTLRKKRKVNSMAKRRRNYGTKVGRSWSTHSAKKRKKNPGRVRRIGAYKRRVKRTLAAVPVGRRYRRRSNPTYRVRRVHHRRNPGFLSGTGSLLPKALGFLGGMVGARYLTQMVLGANNQGYVGYAGNLVASVALGMVTTKVTKNKELGNTVLIGGVASTIMRVIFDKTQYGSFIQAQLGMSGRGGDAGLGILTDSSFPVPQVAKPGSMTEFITPRNTRGYVQAAQQAAMVKAGSPGMGSMTGRRVRGAVI